MLDRLMRTLPTESPSNGATEGEPSGPLQSWARAHPLASFFPLAYAWSWIVWVIVPYVIRRHMVGWKWDTFDIVVLIVGTFGPTAAAFVVQWMAYRNLRLCPFWTGWQSMTLGLGAGLAGMFLMSVVSPVLALSKVAWTALHWSAALHWSTYNLNYSSLLGGPLGEEPGWRGFALPRLQAAMGRMRGSAVLAVLWAGWHLPLFLMSNWIGLTRWEFLLVLLGFAMVLTVAANLARFSVLVAISLHVFFNSSSGVVGGILQGLPTRQHDAVIAALAMFLSGTLLGLAGFRFFRPAIVKPY